MCLSRNASCVCEKIPVSAQTARFIHAAQINYSHCGIAHLDLKYCRVCVCAREFCSKHDLVIKYRRILLNYRLHRWLQSSNPQPQSMNQFAGGSINSSSYSESDTSAQAGGPALEYLHAASLKFTSAAPCHKTHVPTTTDGDETFFLPAQ